MMIDPQEEEYIPKHMRPKAIEATLARLRKLVDELPEDVVLSVDFGEVVPDGKEKK